MCSELHGDMQRLAEMTSPVDTAREQQNCNTDYLFHRYSANRNFTPLEQVQSVNQDAHTQLIAWAGNLTCSNRSLQGVLKD